MTTALAAAVAVGFAGQADAAEQNPSIKTKVVQLQAGDKEGLQDWLSNFYQSFNVEDLGNGQCKITIPGQESFEPIDGDKPDANQGNGSEQEKEPKQEEPTNQPAPAPEKPSGEQQPSNEDEQASEDVSQEEQQMLDLVNQARQQNGLQPLKVDSELTKVARVKAKDMIDNNYFDHNSPTYGSPFDMMNQFGIQYNTAGENLAGNQTVEAAHQALMDSQGHRENILNSGYTEVGIGIVDGGQYGKMFVQLFKG